MSRATLILKTMQHFLDRNSPVILTAVAVGGVASTAVLAAKGGMSAADEIRDIQDEIGADLTITEKVQHTWSFFIPAAAVGSTTIACVLGANTISSRRQAALMSAYAITDKAFQEYRAKVQEVVGEKREKEVRTAIAQDRINNDPPNSSQIIVTGNGEVLCTDVYTGRYFKSSMTAIERAQNKLNQQIINDNYASQNDFLRMLGLPEMKFGEEYGWNTDRLLELSVDGGMSENGEPCLVVDYNVHPHKGYHKFG